MPHWLAKLDSALSPLQLERLFLGRNKFHHFRIWFRRELAQYVLDLLLDKQTATRPYLNRNFLEKMVSGHLRGDHSYTNEINMVLTAELLHRLLIENN
jgi:asparagine synthase (glutamine-hydrolysing)